MLQHFVSFLNSPLIKIQTFFCLPRNFSFLHYAVSDIINLQFLFLTQDKQNIDFHKMMLIDLIISKTLK